MFEGWALSFTAVRSLMVFIFLAVGGTVNETKNKLMGSSLADKFVGYSQDNLVNGIDNFLKLVKDVREDSNLIRISAEKLSTVDPWLVKNASSVSILQDILLVKQPKVLKLDFGNRPLDVTGYLQVLMSLSELNVTLQLRRTQTPSLLTLIDHSALDEEVKFKMKIVLPLKENKILKLLSESYLNIEDNQIDISLQEDHLNSTLINNTYSINVTEEEHLNITSTYEMDFNSTVTEGYYSNTTSDIDSQFNSTTTDDPTTDDSTTDFSISITTEDPRLDKIEAVANRLRNKDDWTIVSPLSVKVLPDLLPKVQLKNLHLQIADDDLSFVENLEETLETAADLDLPVRLPSDKNKASLYTKFIEECNITDTHKQKLKILTAKGEEDLFDYFLETGKDLSLLQAVTNTANGYKTWYIAKQSSIQLFPTLIPLIKPNSIMLTFEEDPKSVPDFLAALETATEFNVSIGHKVKPQKKVKYYDIIDNSNWEESMKLKAKILVTDDTPGDYYNKIDNILNLVNEGKSDQSLLDAAVLKLSEEGRKDKWIVESPASIAVLEQIIPELQPQEINFEFDDPSTVVNMSEVLEMSFTYNITITLENIDGYLNLTDIPEQTNELEGYVEEILEGSEDNSTSTVSTLSTDNIDDLPLQIENITDVYEINETSNETFKYPLNVSTTEYENDINDTDHMFIHNVTTIIPVTTTLRPIYIPEVIKKLNMWTLKKPESIALLPKIIEHVQPKIVKFAFTDDAKEVEGLLDALQALVTANVSIEAGLKLRKEIYKLLVESTLDSIEKLKIRIMMYRIQFDSLVTRPCDPVLKLVSEGQMADNLVHTAALKLAETDTWQVENSSNVAALYHIMKKTQPKHLNLWFNDDYHKVPQLKNILQMVANNYVGLYTPDNKTEELMKFVEESTFDKNTEHRIAILINNAEDVMLSHIREGKLAGNLVQAFVARVVDPNTWKIKKFSNLKALNATLMMKQPRTLRLLLEEESEDKIHTIIKIINTFNMKNINSTRLDLSMKNPLDTQEIQLLEPIK
ncbi:unnamed protein product, partial [Meganyctiphanes norvegica]